MNVFIAPYIYDVLPTDTKVIKSYNLFKVKITKGILQTSRALLHRIINKI